MRSISILAISASLSLSLACLSGGCSSSSVDGPTETRDTSSSASEDTGSSSSDETGDGDATASNDGASSDDGSSGCASDHPMVGATAELEMKQHNVSGTARIVDNCTIVIENFSYDGGGLSTVRIYGTSQSPSRQAFQQGYPISRNLKGESFEGERFVTELPEQRSLDDLNAISVWCTDASVDFGSGAFTK